MYILFSKSLLRERDFFFGKTGLFLWKMVLAADPLLAVRVLLKIRGGLAGPRVREISYKIFPYPNPEISFHVAFSE